MIWERNGWFKKIGWAGILSLLWIIAVADLFLNGFKLTTAFTSKGAGLTFSGYHWTVKEDSFMFGSRGPFFLNSSQNVWVDKSGRLHLKILKMKGIWYCSEVICRQSLGYGRYSFDISTPVGKLDKNVVLGLFTWSEHPLYAFREIDIEFSKWGRVEERNSAQYVIQPWTNPGNRHRFHVSPNPVDTTHSFTWLKKRIFFQSGFRDPNQPETNQVLHEWTCRSRDIPVPGNEKVHINLFLAANRPPSDGQEVEIIIKQFQFTRLEKFNCEE